MKRICCLIFCVFWVFAGCGARKTDWFAPFCGGFSAEVTGKVYDLSFSALIEAEPASASGVMPLTVTFYAPTTLSGTVLRRGEDGTVSLSLDGLTVTEGIGGLAPLLSLFPTAGEITGVTVSENGRTRVEGDEFLLEFLADGVPYLVENRYASVTVVRWQSAAA